MVSFVEDVTNSALLKEKTADVEDHKEEHALQSFFYKIKSKIIHDKQAFLLNELLKDVALISEDPRGVTRTFYIRGGPSDNFG